MIDFIDIGANGINGTPGADGGTGGGPNGAAGGPGADGEDLAFTADPVEVPTPEAEVLVDQTGGAGGNGGEGGEGDATPGDGGDGGPAGAGGDATARIQDLVFWSDATLVITRSALATGGDGGLAGPGGAGGSNGVDTGGVGGDAGVAGAGGAALAEVVGIRIESTGGGPEDILLSADAVGGFGGGGGSGGAAVFGAGVGAGSAGAAGGAATARLAGNRLGTGGGQDFVVLTASALAGDGGDSVAGNGGAGGAALVEVTGNQVRTRSGADAIVVAADGLGGLGGAAGGGLGDVDGTEGDDAIVLSGNVFDLGGGQDTLTLILSNCGCDPVEVAGNVFIGGGGLDLLDFSFGGPVAFDMRDSIVRSFELILGSAADDEITGANKNDLLHGYDGFDLIAGGRGDDTIAGGDGRDTLDGGLGIDTLAYLHPLFDQAALPGSPKVDVDLAAGTAKGQGLDVISGFENVVGSIWSDRIAGDGQNNLLDGVAGKDTLTGAAGADTLIGCKGMDTLDGGADADVYLFRNRFESSALGGDLIVGWDDGDLIDVSAIDANEDLAGHQAFIIHEGPPRSGNPKIGVLYITNDGVDTQVGGDVTGDKQIDFLINIEALPIVDAADFVV